MGEVFSGGTEKIKEEKVGNFDEQFEQIEVVDGIEMLKIETEKPNNKNTVLFAPGWSRTIPTFKESLKTLHGLDRDLVTLNHPRKGGSVGGINDFNEYVANEIKRRATSLYEVLKKQKQSTNENTNSDGVDIVAQSMGGVDALLAALIADDKFPGSVENIVLVESAGMVDNDSLRMLAMRFVGQIKENNAIKSGDSNTEHEKQNVAVAGSEFVKYVKSNPARALAEVSAMVRARTDELIKKVRERGIKVALIHGVDDLTFPQKKVQENIFKKGLATAGDFVERSATINEETKQYKHQELTELNLDGFISVKGGHNEIYLRPEKYMALAENILTDLDKKEIKK